MKSEICCNMPRLPLPVTGSAKYWFNITSVQERVKFKSLEAGDSMKAVCLPRQPALQKINRAQKFVLPTRCTKCIRDTYIRLLTSSTSKTGDQILIKFRMCSRPFLRTGFLEGNSRNTKGHKTTFSNFQSEVHISIILKKKIRAEAVWQNREGESQFKVFKSKPRHCTGWWYVFMDVNAEEGRSHGVVVSNTGQSEYFYWRISWFYSVNVRKCPHN
jgi:hypothetical protein